MAPIRLVLYSLLPIIYGFIYSPLISIASPRRFAVN